MMHLDVVYVHPFGPLISKFVKSFKLLIVHLICILDKFLYMYDRNLYLKVCIGPLPSDPLRIPTMCTIFPLDCPVCCVCFLSNVFCLLYFLVYLIYVLDRNQETKELQKISWQP
ncbi:hypothetical protein EUGRSUZ_L03481 [Eucalyptus grandis]|uniref:Uncharacterized protein n=1 Tax=Eucalyptus grandis TaxID=71139 RepID=A0AAD9T8B9_EUCGR|nr:hypothetical protein EUGRSUZ_L03481 [Eucalyptus grandis]